MLVENIMYFALGLLVAGLVALVIMPAIWQRAVRLTKRRIEAATPITLAEFRADKDQLRAEFALSTRRLEMHVETLRQRLTEQLADSNQKRTDLGALRAERDASLAIARDLEAREADLRDRVLALEKEGADLAQRLRMRERELDGRNGEIETLRSSLRSGLPAAMDRDGAVSGDQNDASSDLIAAEARIASAESQLNSLLAETSHVLEQSEGRTGRSLADKLSLEDELERLRVKVTGVESAIVKDWQTERFDEARLRERLDDIAASVSRLVYSEAHEPAGAALDESLFDRVQRFADDGETEDVLPPAPVGAQRGTVSDRLAALREIQGR